MKIKIDYIGAFFVIIALMLISVKYIIAGYFLQIMGNITWMIYGKQVNSIGLLITNGVMIFIAIYGILNWSGII